MKKRRLTPVEKLVLRVQQELDLPLINVRRTYTGRNMKASGAWTWIAGHRDSPNMEIGSSTPITELLKAPRLRYVRGWSVGQFEIEADIGFIAMNIPTSISLFQNALATKVATVAIPMDIEMVPKIYVGHNLKRTIQMHKAYRRNNSWSNFEFMKDYRIEYSGKKKAKLVKEFYRRFGESSWGLIMLIGVKRDNNPANVPVTTNVGKSFTMKFIGTETYWLRKLILMHKHCEPLGDIITTLLKP